MAKGGCLAAYRWDNGGTFEGRPFNPDTRPADAHILIHVFLGWIGLFDPEGIAHFRDTYFVGVDRKAPGKKKVQTNHLLFNPLKDRSY